MELKAIRTLLLAQDGVVAVWQLIAAGVSEMAIRHASLRWRRVFDGVYVSGHAAITDHQRLIAASLTAPATAVERYSAGWFYGLRTDDKKAVTVVRPGHGGIRRCEPLEIDGARDPRFGLVTRYAKARPESDEERDGAAATDTDRAQGRAAPPKSAESAVGESPTAAGDTKVTGDQPRGKREPEVPDVHVVDGVRITTPARTVLQLVAATKYENQQARLVREALRLGLVTPADLRDITQRRKGDRGVAVLRGLLDQYGRLPIDRTKSDGEAAALAVLAAAGIRRPLVNVLIEGREGDLVWVAERYLLELDSTTYHPFPARDEEKSRIWRAAGWHVDRLPTDVATEAPELLIATVRAGLAQAYRR